MSGALNLAEVQSKLVRHGWTSEEAWEDATSPVQQILPFNQDHARIAGDLTTRTRQLGLSLGDRACLALGLALNAPIYTFEEVWKSLRLDVPVHLLR